jgi:hypothetical protein
MLVASYAGKGVKTSDPGCQETPSTSHFWHSSPDALGVCGFAHELNMSA